MKKILLYLALVLCIMAAPSQDKMAKIPGYPDTYNTSGYSGYLSLKSVTRATHYVFLESIKGVGNKDPVTLWMNGGPGCSSMLGYLQEVGPYYLEDGANYKKGDLFTENKYSWHKVSNLLFFQSPAGVGYSYNLDKNFKYNDTQTALDNFNSLLDFYAKFPQFLANPFWITGQSYAGKYIPDLAVLIDKHNKVGSTPKINFKGIMVGNGVMTFKYLQESTYEFLIDRSFVDPIVVADWKKYCQQEPSQKKCEEASDKIDMITDGINPYDVYGYCFTGTVLENAKQSKVYESQASILNKYKQLLSKPKANIPKYDSSAPCAYFDGVYNYFTLNDVEYKTKFSGQKWNGPCTSIDYTVTPSGSIEEYKYLTKGASANYTIVLYNGNWDAVVPFIDTLKGFKELGLTQTSADEPWFTEDQHSGFKSTYSFGVQFVTIKGASHQVPQAKRAESLNLFTQVLNSRKNEEMQSGSNLLTE